MVSASCRHKNSHFFGRVPSGIDYEYWSNLSRIGKISWWGNKLVVTSTHKFQRLIRAGFYFDLAADQNYRYYNLAKQFNLLPRMKEHDFLLLKSKTVKTDNVHIWSPREYEELKRNLKLA